MPAATPIVLNGRYELGQLVAEGGMAHVFRGLDRVLDRDVAIKILRAQYAASPEFLDRFRREARLAAALAHPNLVNVYDVGEDGDRHYIVMELLPGRTLKDSVAGRPLPLEEAVTLARQVALGMAFAHRRGLVHRDLKPQNVLLTEDGQAKVADFGLAQVAAAAQVTSPGTVWGTVQYISPEQAQGLPADARSDVYALGAVIFELLTGHPPYVGETPAAIMMKHVYDPPPDVQALNAAVPAAAGRVVRRAMAKSADDRYQTMDEFAQALGDLRASAAAETAVWSAVNAPNGRRRAPDAESPDHTRALPAGVPPRRAGLEPQGGAAAPRLAARTVAAPPRRRDRRLPLVLAGAVMLFFALMAAGAALARQVLNITPPTARQTPATPAFGLAAQATATSAPATPTVATVPIPNVVGDPLPAAQAKLAAAGLTGETAGEEFHREVPRGAVAFQEPAANARLEQGKPVRMTVSRGPQRAPVPNVIGEPIQTATTRLTGAGFTVKRVDEHTTLAVAGTVFDQSPRGGEADVGSEVTVKVSQGRDVVAVPEVRNLTEPAARELLAKEGLKADVAYGAFPGVETGVVFASEPPPTTQVDRGATVVLRVRRDPTPVPPTATAVPPTPVPASPTRPPATATVPAATAAPTAAPTTATQRTTPPGQGGQPPGQAGRP